MKKAPGTQKARRSVQPPKARSTPSAAQRRSFAGWLWPAAILAIVLVYYWIPLTSSGASVQWDAVDVHYSSQKYFADRIVRGEVPFWTPYIFSGFPFLADPQVAAWYPPNWPFFLGGITPWAIQAELVLHALLACLGAFLLFRSFVPNHSAALIGALFYALSGSFAEHSSHVGIFSTAAALPWILLCFERALERSAVRNTVLAGGVGGIMILAGHFQTSLYAFTGVALFGLARLIDRPRLALRIVSILAGIAVIAILLSSIQTLPGLELTQHSGRAGLDYAQSRVRVLNGRGVLNLFWPNATGIFDHPDGSGITDAQYYLYSGFLLIPLAAAGLRLRPVRTAGLLLIVLPFWYMFGPDGGFYRVAVWLPGFRSVRSPIHFWFVPVMGLALLAAAGASWILDRWKQPKWAAALILVVFADLFYWNSFANPLAYARFTFTDLYGGREQVAREKVAATQPPVTRFRMPDRLTVFGPLNHPLDIRLEATYGYNPLELQAYVEYSEAMTTNPKLENGLNVTRSLDTKAGALALHPDSLPRAYFARAVQSAGNMSESLQLLQTLDPAKSAIVLGPAPAAAVDSQATASVSEDGEQAYRIRYRSSVPALLKISVPFFPGWEATVDGRKYNLVRVDHALMGVVVPGGDKELLLQFRSTWFGVGALLSGGTLVLCLGICLWPRLKRALSGAPSAAEPV